MLGVILLYVGAVLINNGTCSLMKVNAGSTAALNVIVGLLLTILNLILVLNGEYFAAATGLLFAITYLFIAANNIWGLNLKPYGIYSLFVAINTIPVAYLVFSQDWRMAVIWLAWGVLWLTGFIEGAAGKSLGKFVPVLAILEGILTAWIPGFLMLIGKW